MDGVSQTNTKTARKKSPTMNEFGYVTARFAKQKNQENQNLMHNEEDGISILSVTYKDIKNLEIISYLELPVERQLFDLAQKDADGELVAEILSLIEICLADPKRISEFDDLQVPELYEFFYKWIRSSRMADIEGSDQGTIL